MKRFIHDGNTGKVTEETFTAEEEAAVKAQQAEDAKTLWLIKRLHSYPAIGDQLDDLYKKGAFSDDMAAKIKKVKEDNPKP